jgi:hypothetical protein
MKKDTKKVAMIMGAFIIFSIASELPDIINPTPLSRVRERVLIKIACSSLLVAGVQIFAKE